MITTAETGMLATAATSTAAIMQASGTWTLGLDLATVALISGTFFVAGLIKGMIGLGLPIVVLSLLATTIGLKPALALMIVPGIVMNIWQALDGPYFRSNLSRLWSMWLVSVGAIWIGAMALATIDGRPVTVLLGLVLSAYAVVSLVKPRLPPPQSAERWLNPVIGAIAGFLFGLTGTYMVPGVLYIEAIGLNRDAFVQALGMTFLVITSALGIGLLFTKLMTAELGLASAASLVPAIVGLKIGQIGRRHIPELLFRRIFFIWLAITGLFISWRAFI